MEIKDLLDKDGWEFEAIIFEKPCVGKITVENNIPYLCQNTEKGDSCRDRKGFNYSYGLYDYHFNGSRPKLLKDFKLIAPMNKVIESGNWYIRGSEEFAEFLELEFIENPNRYVGYTGYIYYIESGILRTKQLPYGVNSHGYKTLVTVQDLKNYYMKDKQVEYYELLKDLPNVSKGSRFWYNTGQKNWECCINNVTYSDEVIKASTKWFKPHYKNVVPQIGEYKLEKEGGGIWKFGCTEFDAEYLLTLYSSSKELFITKNELSFNISGHTISMQKLEEIVNYIKSNS